MRKHALNRAALVFFAVICIFATAAFSQAPYRVASAYEDTMRAVVLINTDARGVSWCDRNTVPVGPITGQFVLTAIDTSRIRNVKVLPTQTTSWDMITSLWGGDTLPHVIIHVNAGWYTFNGPYIQDVFGQAVSNKIGIVSIGDDAAHLAIDIFGFDGVENVPTPMGDAQFIDSLWIRLLRQNDERLKDADFATGGLKYPYVNGVISNAIDSVMGSQVLHFYPPGVNRCQADADKYTILYPSWTTFLGYQQGYQDGSNVGAPNELSVIVAIQDTIDIAVRRAVALSFQPQFIQDTVASQQIIYDAMMFASQAHTLSVPSRILIAAEDDTVRAGDTITLHAYIIDQFGDTIFDPRIANAIQWSIVTSTQQPGDMLLGTEGQRTEFTATRAHREVHIRALHGISNLSAVAAIWVAPAAPHHLVAACPHNQPQSG